MVNILLKVAKSYSFLNICIYLRNILKTSNISTYKYYNNIKNKKFHVFKNVISV